MSDGVDWISKKAADTLNPSQVERTLLQLEGSWPRSAPPLAQLIEDFPLGETALLHLLSVSSICATRLVRDPTILTWLATPEVSLAPRSSAQIANDLQTALDDVGTIAASNFRALRRWKGRQTTRIALREVANVAPLEQTTAELSHVAEICIRRVLEHCDAQLRNKYGSPEAEFCVIGLGKLGGQELNHSSDVDLIFVYGEEGELSPRLSYHEFFNRLGEKILASFSATDPEGALLRVDVRLRPEGSAGPLARSLESMEHYYGGFGETWERLALIKARGIAGSREVAYDFLRQLQPFIYPKSPTPDLLEEIAQIKRRIERDVVGHSNLGRDVKLGRGGIREIEFIVQTLQFVHAARHIFLQEPSTLKALCGLARLELIPKSEVVDLERAYRFLRRTEHRLQIEAEAQTHTVPANPEQLRRLALSLGFISAEQFQSALEQETLAVREIFRRVIADAPAAGDIGAIELSFVRSRALAERALADLAQAHGGSGHVSRRTRQGFRKLQPLLLTQLARVADPDAALTRLVRFAEAYGLRSKLFELLVVNPRLLELLIKTLDASRFAADLLVRRPHLLEENTRGQVLDRPAGVADHLRALKSIGTSEAALERIRAYRHTQILRVILRDLLGLSDVTLICRELSDLAEACLLAVNQIAGDDDLTIIALGKFGGREISYGADLDVLFVGENERPAQKLLSMMAQPSAEGSLPRVDARLRPEGEQGPLVGSVEAYRRYYAGRAQLWEMQSLTRARAVTGPREEEFMSLAKGVWQQAGQQPDLFARIDNMLERVRQGRGSGSEFLDFKTGTGGMVEAEFLVQALQMRSSVWEPNWHCALSILRDCNLISKADAAAAIRGYEFLRRCELVLRRLEHTPVSTLPADAIQQDQLSKRLGYKEPGAFAHDYQQARATIEALYERYIRRSIA